MPRKSATDALKATEQAFQSWLTASERLAAKVYASDYLSRKLAEERPFNTLHSDALEVLRVQRGLKYGQPRKNSRAKP